MVRAVLILAIAAGAMSASQSFEETCIKCHQAKEIPNEVIYKRYLLKYSSKIKIREAIVSYLKNPMTQKSIMPPQFIKIFGLKEALKLSDAELNRHVDELINRYSIKKKLYIEPKEEQK